MSTKKRLTALEAGRLKTPGRYSVGGNLFLHIRRTPSGFLSKTWSFRYEKDGKRHDLGLGSAVRVSFARAGIKAAKLRLILDEGGDPFPVKAAPRPATITFHQHAEEYIQTNGAGWSESHRHQWCKTIDDYLAPIAKMAIETIDTTTVVECLKPLRARIPATSAKVRGVIETVLASATAHGLRSGPNPAAWRRHLENILSEDSGETRHHAAMPYADLADFIRILRANDSRAARALEFTILTAARSAETRFAAWSEIDFAAKLWTVPANRMKSGREHRVPLCARAIQILEDLAARRTGDFVFAGARASAPIGKMAMADLMPPPATVHGFRSSFRDWAGNETQFPREIAEQALAHSVGNGVEQAYRRGDALERRRELMAVWSRYCAGGNVVSLRNAR